MKDIVVTKEGVTKLLKGLNPSKELFVASEFVRELYITSRLTNKNKKFRSFKSKDDIHKKGRR